jgi:hypothetical protein
VTVCDLLSDGEGETELRDRSQHRQKWEGEAVTSPRSLEDLHVTDYFHMPSCIVFNCELFVWLIMFYDIHVELCLLVMIRFVCCNNLYSTM